MSVGKSAYYDLPFEERARFEWSLLREQLSEGKDIFDQSIFETAEKAYLARYRKDPIRIASESAASFYLTVKKIYTLFNSIQLINYLVDTGTDITCSLIRQASDKKFSLHEQIEAVNKFLFSTPLFFLVRSNRALCDLRAGWDLIKSTLSLVGRIRKGAVCSTDFMRWGSAILEIYVRVGLRQSTHHSQWAARNHYLSLQSFNDFVSIGLSLVHDPTRGEESRVFTLRTSDIDAFVKRLSDQEIPQLPLVERERLLRDLAASGVTSANLQGLPRIPSQLFHDRVLGKYLCAISREPVRFPVIIRVNGELRLCDQKNLEEKFGSITNCLPDSLRPTKKIEELNCFPKDITILKRTEPRVLKEIEERLALLSNVLATQIEGKVISHSKESRFQFLAYIRDWILHRIHRQGSQTEALIELVDSVAATPLRNNGRFHEYYYEILSRLAMLATFKSTTTYSWIESKVFKWISIHLLGEDLQKIDSITRKYSNLR